MTKRKHMTMPAFKKWLKLNIKAIEKHIKKEHLKDSDAWKGALIALKAVMEQLERK